MDRTALAELLHKQDGVVSRRQVLECGGDDNAIEVLVRRREWNVVHRGVYVDHTGPLTWSQRSWAAVLRHWPCALAGESALVAHGLVGVSRSARGRPVIELVVDESRSVQPADGSRVRRIVDYDAAVLGHLAPPRVRVEHALLDVASRARTEDDAVAVLSDGCQSRRTTAHRLVAALEQRPRLRHRQLLLTILRDVASGAYSALERRYLVKVERPHGLPTGCRQRRVRVGKSPAYRDVDYLGQGVVVELDGRLGHEETADRWDDLDRDLGSALAGSRTLRVGWRQVLEPCRLAAVVGTILRAHGWSGRLRPCGPGCPVVVAVRADTEGFPAA